MKPIAIVDKEGIIKVKSVGVQSLCISQDDDMVMLNVTNIPDLISALQTAYNNNQSLIK